MKLIFATNNQHKVEEIRSAIPENLEVVTLQDAGIDIDIPEPYATLHENAAGKARTIFEMTGTSCFSEDTGLEVAVLNGEPGVHSARYAGDEKLPEKNVNKLLAILNGKSNRIACFRTVICLIWKGNEYFFEGRCDGTITISPKGKKGFGYDPVFIPDGSERTFAEMDIDEKNLFSHRKKAADMLVTFLKQIK
jgi:XTP/dITP diphosphohydrolase